MSYFTDEEEIVAVVKGFESCTTGKDNFGHRSHLTVAVWYLRRDGPALALEQMRRGLQKFLAHHAIDPAHYKEELTQSWMMRVSEVLEELPPALSLVETTNEVVERLNEPHLFD